MAKEDIRRYSLQQLREMNERGEVSPTPANAPGFDGDDEFWSMLEEAFANKTTSVVHLKLDPGTIEYFRKAGPNYLERMARVLDNEAKKAS